MRFLLLLAVVQGFHVSPFGVKQQVENRNLQSFVPASQTITSCQELDASSYGYYLGNPSRGENIVFQREGFTNPNMEECSYIAYDDDFCLVADDQSPFTLLCSVQFVGLVVKDEAQYQSQTLTTPLLGISNLATTKDDSGKYRKLESIEVCLAKLECPSAAPSAMPSLAPSASPSANPTSTPYPTISPSSAPSSEPSSQPSSQPSFEPTVSIQPSAAPSSSPSASPSSNPTVSMVPSSSPSSEPSISQMPSSAPTYISQVKATFSVLLKLPVYLNSTHIRAFEQATEEWAETYDPLDGSVLSNVEVSVIDQVLRDLDGDGSNEDRALLVQDRLEIRFDVDATYAGSDTDFDLFYELNPVFQSNDQKWIRSLGNKDAVFLPLREDPSKLVEEEKPNGEQISFAGKTGVILVSFCAVVMTVAASIFAVRHHQMNARGQSLRDSMSNADMKIQRTFSSEGSSKSEEVMSPKPLVRINSTKSEETKEEERPGSISSYPTQASLPLPISPNTMERGGRDSQEIFRDPPTASEVNYGKRSLADDATEMSHNTSGRPPVVPNRRSTFGLSEVQFSEADFESSRGARVHGGTTLGSTTTGSSSMGAQAKSMFNRMMGIDEKETPAPRNNADFQMSGIYDVFAPAGPIGIVVDTTKDGPAVHSLKPNSPMLGLINPGDLLIGLDDQDTRGMTAATLTKLMAQKANQRERKITLLERK